ncbi:hypothetical protein FB472_1267 [Rhodoglobus vestalii]|uniref:Uncharacterized protein n=1 Tax=Rhodoglobus vestalii TaxID=193384 RepID=A0A8H2K693_9MICO|nr:hypothetical protein [Rhodoglobus vestalii]TQO19694.1 hypothetical protein FB472_1267 [Rhodoglobus vestalii]
MSAENPKNSFINPNLQSVIPPEQGGGRVSPTPSELDNQPEKKKSRKALYAVVGSVAGAAVVAASILGIEAANNQPDKRPVATAPAEPSETPEATPTNTAEVLTVQLLEIPATLTPEQVGTTLIQDRLSAWYMTGANDQTYEERLAYNPSGKTISEVTSDFVDQKAAGYGVIFAEALFIPDYQADEKLNAQATGWQKQNATGLAHYLSTHSEANVYTSSMTVESTAIISQTEDSLALKINGTEYNNAAQNSTGTSDPGAVDINGNRFEVAVTLQLIDGTYKIAQIGISNLGR